MKRTLIILGVVFAIIILIVGIFASKNNSVITLEEQIQESKSAINIQEKRREDLIYNLVDTVKSYAKYEQDTLTKVVEARSAATNGKFEDAKTLILAIAEQYPELKTNEQYSNLMIELTSTENTIANYRNNYNTQVKKYNKYIRKFPNSLILSMLGYETLEEDYLSYEASQDAPRNLFKED